MGMSTNATAMASKPTAAAPAAPQVSALPSESVRFIMAYFEF